MDTEKTIAEKVSALFGDDGTAWETDDGYTLRGVCLRYGAPQARYQIADGDGFDGAHYVFSDGSAIVAYMSGWDIGYADCTCMRGAGHTEDCAKK